MEAAQLDDNETGAMATAQRARDGSRAVVGSGVADFEFDVVVNSMSGSTDYQKIMDCLSSGEHPLRVASHCSLEEADDIPAAIRAVVEKAAAAGHAVLIAGGDGSINLAVKHAIEYEVPLAVLGQGTFNLFAADHGIDRNLERSLAQLATSCLTPVAISFINDEPFTTSVNFGLYPEIIRQRERHQAMTGLRTRVTAYLSGLYTFLTRRAQIKLRVRSPRSDYKLRAQLLMVTQNRTHLENLDILDQIQQAGEHLVLVSARPESILDKLKLLMDRVRGCLVHSDQFDVEVADEFTFAARQPKLEVAIDGELLEFTTPIQLRIRPNALQLFKPVNANRN